MANGVGLRFPRTEALEVGKKPAPKHEKPLFLRLPPAYHDALAQLARKSRRTLTAEATIALEEYFAKNGMSPPATPPKHP
jgi:hypothetical protein